MLAEAGSTTTSRVEQLWLQDFRCFGSVEVSFPAGLTVLYGDNGQGKTSLLEAVGWVARARSFRGVADAALVRRGAAAAVVRAEVGAGTRTRLFEAEIRGQGRNRIQVNRQAVARRRDLYGLLRVTVFAPDDLELVKGGPAGRRSYLDELLSLVGARYDAAASDYERVLRHRNALLRGPRHDELRGASLAVFDEQLVRAGAELVRGRLRLTARLLPAVDAAYRALAGHDAVIHASYDPDWCEPLTADDVDAVEDLMRAALERTARAEAERGVTLVGPHRDEWRITIGGLDARTQASQGEQRTLALALRLAGHAVVADLTGDAPVLLLDDVFSELDHARAEALVRSLPAAQTLVTTAGSLPATVTPQQAMRVAAGRVETMEP